MTPSLSHSSLSLPLSSRRTSTAGSLSLSVPLSSTAGRRLSLPLCLSDLSGSLSRKFQRLSLSLSLSISRRPEWDVGGFPAWLLVTKPALRLRSSDPNFLHSEFAPLQIYSWFRQ